MAYQGYHDGQANANYDPNFNGYTDAGFGELGGGFYGTDIDGLNSLDFSAPVGLPTQLMVAEAPFPSVQQSIPSGLTFPAPQPQQGTYGNASMHLENSNGNFVHNQTNCLPMPLPMPPVLEPHHNTFYPQQEPPMVPTYAPAQAPIPVTGSVHGSSLASDHGVSPPKKRRFTSTRAPGTPVVLERWKYFRTTEERKRMKLKEGKIPRITHKKKETDPIDPQCYYGPPVEPPMAWGPIDPLTKQPIFEYTKYGELYQGRQFDRAEMKMYLFGRRVTRLVDAEDWVERTIPPTERRAEDIKRSGLTCWLGWPAAQADYRYPRRPGTQTCRFKDCPIPTIKQGIPRVILDERMNDQGLEIDPFYNAGYVHLYCLEKHFDLIEILMELDFRIDERSFKKEEFNLFSLTGRDGKLDLLKTYQDWWKREFRRYEQAKAQGFRSRDRRNYEETSLGAALLKCKLDHESAARAKTRRSRGGIDVTKYWGDLDMYAALREQHKSGGRTESVDEGYGNRRERRTSTVETQTDHLVQETMVKADPVNPYEYPRYSTEPMMYQTGHQQYQQQYPGYGTVPVAPQPVVSYSPPVVPAYQVSHHEIHVLNQPQIPMPPVYPGVSQRSEPLPYHPAMPYPIEPLLSPSGRKRNLEQVYVEDQSITHSIGEFGVPEPQGAPAKKARHNSQLHTQAQYPASVDTASAFQPNGLPEDMAILQAWNAGNQGSFQTTEGVPSTGEVIQNETFTFHATDMSNDDLNNFSFTFTPPAADQQQIDPNLDPALFATDNLPEVNGESCAIQSEQQVAASALPEQAPAPKESAHPEPEPEPAPAPEPEFSVDQAFDGVVDDHQVASTDDIFNNQITEDEFDAIFGQEATPQAIEEPAQESSSEGQGVEEASEETPKTPEAPRESPPASPRSPASSPSGLSESMWA